MLRSMFSGVAGLKVHQTRMDVIGNNIANVNTTAYKYQSINFSDVMYQTSQNASGATATTGGVNAKQVGLGAINAAISTAITQAGATQTTNNPFDMQITGDSFFIVNDGTGNKYTRDGSFYIDGQGNLAMQSTGYYVMGWGTQEDDTGALTINKNGGLGKLALNTKEVQSYPAEATGAGTFFGNIDKNDQDIVSSAGKTVQYEFYDDKGYVYTADFNIKTAKDAGGAVIEGQYTMELADITDSTGKSIRLKDDGTYYNTLSEMGINFGASSAGGGDTVTWGTNTTSTNTITLSFDSRTGSYTGYTDANGVNNPKTDDHELWNLVQLTFDSTVLAGGDANKSALISSMGQDVENQASIKNITMNLKTTTNNNTNGTATIKTSRGNIEGNQTGRKVGTISGIQVAVDGKITATYTNGQTRLLGQMATAQFANASGLEKQGENIYAATMNSGDPSIMDVSEDGGKISTGVLEMSNVDLSNEFTSMITAQRGFQANSRIITVSDTLLEELTNLKR